VGKWDLGLVNGTESNLGFVNGIWKLNEISWWEWGNEELALILRESEGERRLWFFRGLDLRGEMVVVEAEGRRFKAIIFVAEVRTPLLSLRERERESCEKWIPGWGEKIREIERKKV